MTRQAEEDAPYGALSSEQSRYQIRQTGYVERGENGARLHVFGRHSECLYELDNFSHAQVLWWFSQCDDEQLRTTTRVDPPFDAVEGSPLIDIKAYMPHYCRVRAPVVPG